jgi:hypothetical protein
MHGIPGAEDAVHHAITSVTHIGFVEGVLETVATLIAGVVVGAVAMGVVEVVKRAIAVVRPGASPAH